MTQQQASCIALVVLAGAALSAWEDAGAETNFPRHTVQQLDQAIAAQMQTERLPGVVVLVSVPGEGEYMTARGTS